MHSVQSELIPPSVGKTLIVPLRDFGARCIAVPNRVSAAVAAFEREQDAATLEHIRGVGQSALLAFQAIQTTERAQADALDEPVTYESLATLLREEARICRESAQWCLESLALRDDLDHATSELVAAETAWQERKKLRPRSNKEGKGKKRKAAALRADREAAVEHLKTCTQAVSQHFGETEIDPALVGTSGERLLVGELTELAERADAIAAAVEKTGTRASVINLVEIPNSRVTARSLVPTPQVTRLTPMDTPRPSWIRRLITA